MAGARGRGFNYAYPYRQWQEHRGGRGGGEGRGGGGAFARNEQFTRSESFTRNEPFAKNESFTKKDPIDEDEFRKLKRRSGYGPQMELRLLVRGRNAGSIIGKNGSNIKRIRQQYEVNLFLTDTQSPERIVSIMGDLGSICETILDLIPVIDNNPPSDVTDDVDVRILMHQSQTGTIVGKKGNGIRELRASCNARVKVYGEWCPRSTDRVVQINGTPVDIVNCIATIVELVIRVPPVGLILPYNPNNFVEIKALEYGGFTGYDVTMPFQGETVLGGPDGCQLTPAAATPRMDGGGCASGGSGFDGGPSPGQDMQSPGFYGNRFPSYHPPNTFSPGSYDSPVGPHGFQGGPGPRGQGSYGRGDMGRGYMNQGPRAHGWGSSPVQYPINRGGYGGGGSMGQSPGGYGGGVTPHPMGFPPPSLDHGGGYGQVVKEEGGGGGVVVRQGLDSATKRLPIDQCPGLGFHPIDARTVQVSIPKPLQTVVMGRRGTAIGDIRSESRAKIVIEVPPSGASERFLTLSGTPEQLQKAQYLLQMRYLDGKKSYTDDPEGFMNRGQRKRSHPDAPWMTDDIMKMKLMRRKLERVWRGTKTEEARKDFKDYCMEMNRAIRKVKEEYYKIHGGGPEKKTKPKLDADGNEIPEDKTNEGNSSQEEEEGNDGGSKNSSAAATDLVTQSNDVSNIVESSFSKSEPTLDSSV